ncbi:sn-glycerol-3-phosphate ABC transporter ATP-binding protein UgpC [Acuticoccus sp. MNP-M23]|uniref:ABC transporter ATP-binding protein n=1 Tax=Acuticoccus sp. MNP-M23 TaxID=3072793 RepID=UPI0028149DAE|nr:sn-glycerol-3-phosphate ABC transporter ATP-binding protein UgpC [Acuticoccus sp. MNP-M23]WMS41166.1 sn-glycerol-3-phosphate ABC transporter ATP-binding protein UgpC [Acuticoccus sp. MNP-M23]
MASVSIRNLTKRFDDVEVLHGIDLDIAHGEFIVLVGPSGCGKSTTLRMLAGLEDVSAGEIRIGDKVVNNLEPKARNIAMVFQNYAIYPHMSVEKNIGFGLRTAKLPRADKAKRIRETADLLELTPLLDRRPSQLSGGQRQRVAIGRAMVRDPAVFLFDEPLSNLDAQLRAQMRLEVKRLHQRLGATIVFVTHDQVEAMTLADRIAIMRDGRIEQLGTPDELYRTPVNTFVAQFVGSPSMNLVPGTIGADGTVRLDGIDGFAAPFAGTTGAGEVIVGLRPDELRVGAPEGGHAIRGTVEIVERLGHDALVYLKAGGQTLIAKAEAQPGLDAGADVTVSAPASALYLFDRASGQALPAG